MFENIWYRYYILSWF